MTIGIKHHTRGSSGPDGRDRAHSEINDTDTIVGVTVRQEHQIWSHTEDILDSFTRPTTQGRLAWW